MGDRYVPRYDSWRPSDAHSHSTRREDPHRTRPQSRHYYDHRERRHDAYRRDDRRVPQRRREVATTTPTPARRLSIDRARDDHAHPGASQSFLSNEYTSARRNPGLGYASANATTSFNGYTHHNYSSSNGYSHTAHPITTAHATISAPPAPPIANADPDRVMPKHFAKPLTCFYWATQGCQKTAEECWYCHYHTGIIAAAPVRLGGDGAAIAGTTASLRAHEMSQDDSLLRDRMRIVNAKEASLHESEKRLNDSEKRLNAEAAELRRVVGEMYDALHHLSTAQSDAAQTLTEQREDLTNAFLRSQEAEPGEPLLTTLQTLDTTLTSLSTFKDRISSVAHRLKSTIGVIETDEGDLQYSGSSVKTESDTAASAGAGAQEGLGDGLSFGGGSSGGGGAADDARFDGESMAMEGVADDEGARGVNEAIVGGLEEGGAFDTKEVMDDACSMSG